jgi:DNA-binding response OmpR family regulator
VIKILIVEDDEVTSERLKFSLSKQGYDVVDIATDTLHARNKIAIYNPDLILLDISLDEEDDGFTLAHYINHNYQIPFVFLSSHSEREFIKSAQKVKPYGYLVKPFEANSLQTTIEMALAKFEDDMKQYDELEALYESHDKLEKLMMHTQGGEKKKQEFANGYSFDFEFLELSYQGKLLKITKREKALFQLLLTNMDHVVSYEQMISYIWEEGDAVFNSLRTLVWRLRSKLPTDVIKAVSGEGYMIEH